MKERLQYYEKKEKRETVKWLRTLMEREYKCVKYCEKKRENQGETESIKKNQQEGEIARETMKV